MKQNSIIHTMTKNMAYDETENNRQATKKLQLKLHVNMNYEI